MATASNPFCKKCGFGSDAVDRICSGRSPPEDHDMVQVIPPAPGNIHLRWHLILHLILIDCAIIILILARGKLSGIAKPDSEFFELDGDDDRPRARFLIRNEFVSPVREQEIYALIDSGAQSALILPQSMIDSLGLISTAKRSSSRGSNNGIATKTNYKPVLLEAVFLRGEVQETRFGYLDVAVFDEPEVLVEAEVKDSHIDKKSKRRESEGSKDGVIVSLPLVEHRPRSNNRQRVILGAKALKELGFHVNVADRCLEIEEEHEDEDD
jgi:predicted aspartyl protease